MFDFSAYSVAVDRELDELPIHYGLLSSTNPESAIVLMPSARTAQQTDRTVPYFPRWSWAPRWPNSLVITIADPVMSRFPELDGGWFVHPDHDVLAAIAAVIDRVTEEHGVSRSRVTFYGSSLGGYGAIGAAAELRGARAVAEVPQIDVQSWLPRFVSDLETVVLRQPMSEFRQVHPERISLKDRVRSAGYVPPIHLITNAGDYCIAEQRSFMQWVSAVELPRGGHQVLEEVDHLQGHKVLSQDEVVGRLVL